MHMSAELILGLTVIAINIITSATVLWYVYHWTTNVYNLLEEIRNGLRKSPNKEDPKRTWPPPIEASRWRRR